MKHVASDKRLLWFILSEFRNFSLHRLQSLDCGPKNEIFVLLIQTETALNWRSLWLDAESFKGALE
jgi:hypothetical protein